ncbi:hypothetical protein C8R47DRAFT_1107306 [Mycena vitilis]|nr:hypothetical protein C8R47DRAFT_1107306 [Mycena vitilis]
MPTALPDALTDGESIEPIEAQFLVIHEDETMSSPPKKARSKEFILVPAELVVYKPTTTTADDPDPDSTSSSGDEISIHIEGPAHDESLSSSALTCATDNSTRLGAETDDTAVADATPRRSGRVRFRSRVRITSGLHHRPTASSSLSSSPSSSISAPLRSPPTEDNCTPGWGTLGTRVGLFAISNRQAAQKRHARRRQNGRAPDEASALLGDPPQPGYDGHPDSDDDDMRYDSDEECYDDEALLSHQIDLVFGKWPGRLLNRQWWWWQLQPIVCCGCLDEHDGEDIP